MTEDRGLVVVLDSDPRARDSLARLLASEGYRVRLFAEPKRLLSGGLIKEPACLILELQLGGVSGLDFLGQLGGGGLQRFAVIFLTAHGDVNTAVQAMRLGAFDFLEKPYDPQVLVRSVADAIATIRGQWATRMKLDDLRTRAAALTRRERQVVELVVQGRLNKQIAAQLNLAEVTVKMHRSRAMHRLGAHNSAELTRIATLLEFLLPATDHHGDLSLFRS